MRHARKYYRVEDGVEVFDVALYAKEHPNSLSRDGLTFNEEIAESIHRSTVEMGYERTSKIDFQGPKRGAYPAMRPLAWRI
jgi:hypothetical protein